MFEDMDTPSSESFRANATMTSTPKAHRREWKTERFPSPNMITRPDYPQHREEERRTTRHRSPSPPQPGNSKTQREFKPARRKAPNGENLFHYKLWKQLDISRPPRFTSQQLSAQATIRFTTTFGTRSRQIHYWYSHKRWHIKTRNGHNHGRQQWHRTKNPTQDWDWRKALETHWIHLSTK